MTDLTECRVGRWLRYATTTPTRSRASLCNCAGRCELMEASARALRVMPGRMRLLLGRESGVVGRWCARGEKSATEGVWHRALREAQLRLTPAAASPVSAHRALSWAERRQRCGRSEAASSASTPQELRLTLRCARRLTVEPNAPTSTAVGRWAALSGAQLSSARLHVTMGQSAAMPQPTECGNL